MAEIPLTESNRNFASAVNKRLTADSVMLSAKASVWRFGGIGLPLLLAGAGIGCVLFGYSYVNDDQTLADRMATSFAKVLEHIQVPVKMTEPGVVTMTEPGQVEMNKPGEVEMRKPGEVVMNRPGEVEMRKPGTVTVTGDYPRPSQPQLDGSNNPTINPAINHAKVVTNFSVFKFVPYATGMVVTEWAFSSSEQNVPTSQSCYYNPNPTHEVNSNNYMVASGKLTSIGQRADYQVALTQCYWFGGQPPFQAPTTAPRSDTIPAPIMLENGGKAPGSAGVVANGFPASPQPKANMCGQEIAYTVQQTQLPQKTLLGAWTGIWNSKSKICGVLIVTAIRDNNYNGVSADYYYKIGDKLQYKSLTGSTDGDNKISLKDDENSTFDFTRGADNVLTGQFSGKSGQTHTTFRRG